MDVKEAIGFIKGYGASYSGGHITPNPKLYEVFELLKRGEKFEQMIDEIKVTIKKPYYIYRNDRGKEFHYYSYGNVDELLDKLEQKYFPKPSDNFTEKVMKKINEKVKDETKT